MTTEANKKRLLLLSDLHLGRNCKQITGFQTTSRPDPEFDQAFVDLLDFYTLAREQSWRLIFAGDFIDFVEVVVVPGNDSPMSLGWSFEVTREERSYGLGSEAEHAVVKLEMTFAYHRRFFERLAVYIREGGETVILRGNHDPEFFWPKVQLVFRRLLADLAYKDSRLDAETLSTARTHFQERLYFEEWFYFEPNRLYVEHGHQYDVYCSFDHQLYPISPTNPRRIDMPAFAFAMRYFVNILADFSPQHADFWTAREYAAWLYQKGLGGALYTAKMAINTCFRVLVYAIQVTFGKVSRYGQNHLKHMREIAERTHLPFETLKELDALHHRPVSRNLPELMRLLFLDRILLVLGTLAIVLLQLFTFDNPWAELGCISLTAFAAYGINRKMAPRRYFVPGPKQMQAAGKIAELLDVPLIVMGHSHGRMEVDVGPGKKYINTGCWLPPISSALDHTDKNKPCTCQLTHLVVEDDDETAIRIFCKANHVVRLGDDKNVSRTTADISVDHIF